MQLPAKERATCPAIKHWGLALALFTLTACSNEFSDIPDEELADKAYACRTTTEQSPGFAITCDNYKRECERRREAGKYVC